MKKVLAAAAVAATMMAGSTLAASAATTSPVVSLTDGSFSGTAPAAAYDYFSFTIPFFNSRTVNASISTAAAKVKITAFDFFSSTLVKLETGVDQTFGAGKYFTLDPVTLAAGSYFIGVKASGGNNSASTGYAGVLSVSAVPLPGSVAMFGMALAGLGVAGAMSRKTGRASSAA